MLKEADCGGGVKLRVDALEGGKIDVPCDGFELRDDGVFWGEGGAKEPQAQPHGIQDDNVAEGFLSTVYNLGREGREGLIWLHSRWAEHGESYQ